MSNHAFETKAELPTARARLCTPHLCALVNVTPGESSGVAGALRSSRVRTKRGERLRGAQRGNTRSRGATHLCALALRGRTVSHREG